MIAFAIQAGEGPAARGWDPLKEEFGRRGVPCRIVSTPKRETRTPHQDRARIMVDALRDVEGEVGLIGISKQGLFMPLVAAERPVRRIVMVNAAIPIPRVSFLEGSKGQRAWRAVVAGLAARGSSLNRLHSRSETGIIGCVPKVSVSRQKTGRTFTEEARRRQIVEAAIDVITEEGYGEATLERIAKRAGISRGLISYHFEGRDDLMAAVVGRPYEDGVAYMTARLGAAPQEPAAVLGVYLRANLEFIREHRRELFALLEVRRGGSQGGFRRSMAGIFQALAPLEQILRWGQTTGDFRDFDAHAMAIAIRNVIDGMTIYMKAEPDLDLDRLVAEVVTLFSVATQKEVQ